MPESRSQKVRDLIARTAELDQQAQRIRAERDALICAMYTEEARTVRDIAIRVGLSHQMVHIILRSARDRKVQYADRRT